MHPPDWLHPVWTYGFHNNAPFPPRFSLLQPFTPESLETLVHDQQWAALLAILLQLVAAARLASDAGVKIFHKLKTFFDRATDAPSTHKAIGAWVVRVLDKQQQPDAAKEMALAVGRAMKEAASVQASAAKEAASGKAKGSAAKEAPPVQAKGSAAKEAAPVQAKGSAAKEAPPVQAKGSAAKKAPPVQAKGSAAKEAASGKAKGSAAKKAPPVQAKGSAAKEAPTVRAKEVVTPTPAAAPGGAASGSGGKGQIQTKLSQYYPVRVLSQTSTQPSTTGTTTDWSPHTLCRCRGAPPPSGVRQQFSHQARCE
jgi:hypothetical protein